MSLAGLWVAPANRLYAAPRVPGPACARRVPVVAAAMDLLAGQGGLAANTRLAEPGATGRGAAAAPAGRGRGHDGV